MDGFPSQEARHAFWERERKEKEEKADARILQLEEENSQLRQQIAELQKNSK